MRQADVEDGHPGHPAGKGLCPLVKELAADGIPVAVSCRVLKLADTGST
jgi:hypothetical protein